MTRRCDWAGCTRLAITVEDGWAHCPDDLRRHRELKREEHRAGLDGRVLALWHEGLNDEEIGERLHYSPRLIGKIRQDLGLPVQGTARRCGSEAGYSRHRYYGEQPCQPCKDAHAARTYQRNKRKKAS